MSHGPIKESRQRPTVGWKKQTDTDTHMDNHEYDGHYVCYGCGARICNMFGNEVDDEEEYSCCDRPYLVPWSHVQRARKRWAFLGRFFGHFMPMLRAEMLQRCAASKYAPGGTGAVVAEESFRQCEKKQCKS